MSKFPVPITNLTNKLSLENTFLAQGYIRTDCRKEHLILIFNLSTIFSSEIGVIRKIPFRYFNTWSSIVNLDSANQATSITDLYRFENIVLTIYVLVVALASVTWRRLHQKFVWGHMKTMTHFRQSGKNSLDFFS